MQKLAIQESICIETRDSFFKVFFIFHFGQQDTGDCSWQPDLRTLLGVLAIPPGASRPAVGTSQGIPPTGAGQVKPNAYLKSRQRRAGSSLLSQFCASKFAPVFSQASYISHTGSDDVLGRASGGHGCGRASACTGNIRVRCSRSRRRFLENAQRCSVALFEGVSVVCSSAEYY